MAEAKSAGEREVVYDLNLGEPAVPDQPYPNYPIIGFVAGTPILTPAGHLPIEELRPGDVIRTRPDNHLGDDELDDQTGKWLRK